MPYTLKFGYLLEIRTRIGLLKSRTWLTWSKAFSACHIDSTATRYKVWLVTLLQSPLSLSPSISSLESAFHFRHKTPLFQKSFPLFVFIVPFGLLWTWTGLSGHWRLFVVISSFSLYFFYISVLVTCARLSWPHSAFQSIRWTLLLKYRISRYPPTESCAIPRTHNTFGDRSFAVAGHVFGTVFRPTCATGTLHTAVSGMNSKRFCYVASAAQWDFC